MSRCLAFLLLLGVASGAELTVRNGSFEVADAVETTEVDGWREEQGAAVRLVGGYVMRETHVGVPETPAGRNWLELIGSPRAPGAVYQAIGIREAARACTVTLRVGNRALLADSGLLVELWAGGAAGADHQPLEALGARRLDEKAVALPADGETAEVRLHLTTGKDAAKGEVLWLRLAQPNPPAVNSVVLIDDVRVESGELADLEKATASVVSAVPAAPYYVVKTMELPPEVIAEAGGVCYWPDGTMVYCTRRGNVWTMRDGRWQKFAGGLHEPLGIWADTVGEVYVTQRPELTRIRDLDGDGTADRYETVTAGWGIPGARTDFVYGLRRDAQGNFYGATHTTHGPWAAEIREGGPKGSKTKYNFGGPMGAPMIGRGWSFRVDLAGKLSWWSSGLRAPNGLAFNTAGDLFATDNQGDWVGTNALHHLVEGDFHGHPSSYQWDPKRQIDLKLPLGQLATELDKVRKPPAVWFPYGEMGNSPSEPVLVGENFGPFAGQFLIGDNVQPLISRVYLEKVAGEYQGVCLPFLRSAGLQRALCRMAFAPDGALTVTVGARGWGPAVTGIQQVSWTGKTPFEIETMNLTATGFRLVFTKPLDSTPKATQLRVQSYRYAYHHKYGSPKIDQEQVAVSGLDLAADRRTLRVTLPLKAGKVYDFTLDGFVAAGGEALRQNRAYYTLNRLLPPAPVGERVFFPLCMDTHDAKKRSLAEQAQLFGELGYDGCGHLCQSLGYGNLGVPGTTVEQRAATLGEQGLRLVQAYGRVYLGRPEPIDLARIKEMMPTLAAHRTQLTLLLLGNRKAALDDEAVAVLGKIADIAKPYGVEIVLYPHTSDYTQTVGECLRVLKKLNRPEATGVMFNLSHWLNCDPEPDYRKVLRDSGPWLKAVSINGAHAYRKPGVLPLDEGGFAVEDLVQTLDDVAFAGPVGLMCWAIKGDAREHLTRSMDVWQEWTAGAGTKRGQGVGTPGRRKIVFIGGADSHGPGAHDHKAGVTFLKQALEQAANVPRERIETVLYLDELPDDLSELDDAAAIVLMWEGWQKHLLTTAKPEVLAKFRELMAKGVGLTCLHAATAVGDDVEEEYLRWTGGNKKFQFSLHPMTANVSALVATKEHPITRGVGSIRFEREELYRKILFAEGQGRITPILTANPAVGPADGQTVAWAFERQGGGRSFNCTGPHFHQSFQNPEFRKLLLNAILWIAELEPPAGGVESPGE